MPEHTFSAPRMVELYRVGDTCYRDRKVAEKKAHRSQVKNQGLRDPGGYQVEVIHVLCAEVLDAQQPYGVIKTLYFGPVNLKVE